MEENNVFKNLVVAYKVTNRHISEIIDDRTDISMHVVHKNVLFQRKQTEGPVLHPRMIIGVYLVKHSSLWS